MFTLFDYIMFGCLAICIIITLIALKSNDAERKAKLKAVITEIIILALIVVGCAAYRTHTESGKRGLKTWESETSGGLNRTVIVYDIQGEEIVRYSGKFDIEESSQEGVVKIKFDDNGKRHIIYAQTGTVLIDEN